MFGNAWRSAPFLLLVAILFVAENIPVLDGAIPVLLVGNNFYRGNIPTYPNLWGWT
jgi:hypothetical protein